MTLTATQSQLAMSRVFLDHVITRTRTTHLCWRSMSWLRTIASLGGHLARLRLLRHTSSSTTHHWLRTIHPHPLSHLVSHSSLCRSAIKQARLASYQSPGPITNSNRHQRYTRSVSKRRDRLRAGASNPAERLYQPSSCFSRLACVTGS